MINIQRFICNMLQENCYVVNDNTKECVIIDCGAFYDNERNSIIEYIHKNELKPVHLIATHGHLDHNFGNNTIYEVFSLEPEIAATDEQLMNNSAKQAKTFYGIELEYTLPKAKARLKGNDIIKYGNQELTVLETPGHSQGSITLYDTRNHIAFTGDTLFKNSIGRTDFESGNMMQMIQSLRMLAQLPDETVIFPGHGAQTTIGEELANNPYMDR